ncbi:hypothetical protein OpiT1DRAFT_03869 [Opitutaceae bacterium TAV1]|nr:hypothetical protein OpiT1DRAFT_03869 [Opitutaceae bacterium TAV1]
MKIIDIPGITYEEPSLTFEAIEQRNKLIVESSRIAQIVDELDAENATAVLRDITARLAECETARKSIKAPIDELVFKIQDTAKTYAAPLLTEKDRLSRILGAYQQAQRDKAAREEREAREEAARIAREAAADIAAKQAAHGVDSPEAIQAEQQAAEAISVARQEVAAVVPKIEGTAVKRTWAWELVDINALFAARPDLVTLIPDKTAIRAALKKTQSIPGLRIFEDVKTIIR